MADQIPHEVQVAIVQATVSIVSVVMEKAPNHSDEIRDAPRAIREVMTSLIEVYRSKVP
jgi:hypothetical protein